MSKAGMAIRKSARASWLSERDSMKKSGASHHELHEAHKTLKHKAKQQLRDLRASRKVVVKPTSSPSKVVAGESNVHSTSDSSQGSY